MKFQNCEQLWDNPKIRMRPVWDYGKPKSRVLSLINLSGVCAVVNQGLILK